MSLDRADRPLFLVGFMASGKSTVGKQVASELGRPFLDSDLMIEEKAGKTVAAIFAEDGQARFRALEKEALTELMSMSAVVAALGGGALEDADTRVLLLEAGITIWIDVPLAVIRRRLKSYTDRPLWPQVAREQEALFHARRKFLARAPFRVEAGNRESQRVATDILALYATLIS